MTARVSKSDSFSAEEAAEQLFPSANAPTNADTLASYVFHTGRFGSLGYDGRMADLHARSLESDPDLARMLRSREAIEDCGIAAEHRAHPSHPLESTADASRRANGEAQKRYRRAIAEQLAALVGHELRAAAKVYLAGCAAAEREQAERQAAIAREKSAADEAAAEKLAAERAERARLAAVSSEAKTRALEFEHARDRERMSARLAIAEAVAARILHHGLTEIRLNDGLYDVSNLATSGGEFGIGGGHGIRFLLAVNDAIDRLEAAAEARA
jgi:hypothetical protein